MPHRGPAELLLQLLGHRLEPLGRVRGENKAKIQSFLARKKKLFTEANGATPTKPNKPTRRGKNAGLREIERKILKENTN